SEISISYVVGSNVADEVVIKLGKHFDLYKEFTMNSGIIDSSGTVGRTILQVLEERNFNVDELYLFSSKKSDGETITFNNQDYTLEELEASVFDRDIDVLFFAAGGAVSEKFIPLAKDKGIVAIDNSSVYRMDENVPLIVPEVNRDDLNDETLI